MVRSRLSCPAPASSAVMASTGTANVVIWVPTMETDWPPQNHRKSRLRQIDVFRDEISALAITRAPPPDLRCQRSNLHYPDDGCVTTYRVLVVSGVWVVSGGAPKDTGRVSTGASRSAPATAPGRLGLVQSFLNTLHVERGTDALDAPSTAYAWLAGTAPSPLPPPGAEDLDRLRALRQALRALCGDGSTPDDEVLTRLAAGAPLRLTAAAGGSLHLTPVGDGHQAVVATLLAITYDAQRDGTWARLKICHHDACRWAFFDESRSRTATWCAMGICGNRTKAAAYRRRRAAE